MTTAYWDESYPPEIYDSPLQPVLTIPDATVEAGGPVVDLPTTLDGDPEQDIAAASGKITARGLTCEQVTFSMSWGDGGTEQITCQNVGGNAIAVYGPFGIAAGSHGESTDEVSVTADTAPGDYAITSAIVDSTGKVLTSDDWTLTVTAAPPPAATGAAAGTPGTFTPDGAEPPSTGNPGMLTLAADPVTGWTSGQYVQAGDGTDWYWDGETWAEGQAP